MHESIAAEELVREIPELHPLDEHNQELARQVHPVDWRNPAPRGRYNLVVIGGGTAGLVAAAGAAGLGAKVALIERKLLGGDCLNVGCVPSKALLRAARALVDVRDAGRFGVRVTGEVEADFPMIMQRMRRIRAGISLHDSARRFQSLGVDVFIGAARFDSPTSLKVAGDSETKLTFAKAVIATGARAAAPPIPGLKEAGYLTNESVFSLTALPARLAVIGAGPLGCELAQAFARFGSQVYLIEAEHGIMPKEDPDASRLVQAALVRDGVQLRCCGKNLQVERTAGGKRLFVESHGERYELLVDEILVGAGRQPNVEHLGLEAAGVAYDDHGVEVDDRLQSSNARIFAAGDVCSKFKFTHAADAMARIAIQNALFLGRAKMGALTIPWCTYTDPEVAHVGLSPQKAEKNDIALDTFVQPLDEVDRAVLDDETHGFAKIHVRRGTDRILGATIVARHAGEMISEVTLAMVAGSGLKTLAKVIHPYPTQAEAIKKTADAYNRARLTPLVRSLFHRWLKWARRSR